MKLQILWVPPAERRFGSGDILTAEELAAFGLDAANLLDAGEAQIIHPLDHDNNGVKGGSPKGDASTRKRKK